MFQRPCAAYRPDQIGMATMAVIDGSEAHRSGIGADAFKGGAIRGGVVNRSAVAIAPRQPLIDWSRRISPDNNLAWDPEDHSLYLLPAYEDEAQARQLLEQNVVAIFRNELQSWCTDASLWPAPLSFALFEDWFEVRFYDLVEDLVSEDLVRDQDDPPGPAGSDA